MYTPTPINTDHVQLPPELEELLELLAENTHDRWAQERLSQGWTWGPERDDAKKLHPCLLPYHELSEAEKDLDRITSLETLKVILHLGFRITK